MSIDILFDTIIEKKKKDIETKLVLDHYIIIIIMESNNSSMDEHLSWLEWFLMRDSAPKINNNEKHTLFRIFGAAKDKLEIKAHLLKCDEMVFIFK